mmetsp:Transcript_2430/g.9491  ORF Transcript_2430/g.9491 Transcript_2430/m.9491 type:complete len:231 (-) Transcript_2430:465-1157(-)
MGWSFGSSGARGALAGSLGSAHCRYWVAWSACTGCCAAADATAETPVAGREGGGCGGGECEGVGRGGGGRAPAGVRRWDGGASALPPVPVFPPQERPPPPVSPNPAGLLEFVEAFDCGAADCCCCLLLFRLPKATASAPATKFGAFAWVARVMHPETIRMGSAMARTIPITHPPARPVASSAVASSVAKLRLRLEAMPSKLAPGPSAPKRPSSLTVRRIGSSAAAGGELF